MIVWSGWHLIRYTKSIICDCESRLPWYFCESWVFERFLWKWAPKSNLWYWKYVSGCEYEKVKFWGFFDQREAFWRSTSLRFLRLNCSFSRSRWSFQYWGQTLFDARGGFFIDRGELFNIKIDYFHDHECLAFLQCSTLLFWVTYLSCLFLNIELKRNNIA